MATSADLRLGLGERSSYGGVVSRYSKYVGVSGSTLSLMSWARGSLGRGVSGRFGDRDRRGEPFLLVLGPACDKPGRVSGLFGGDMVADVRDCATVDGIRDSTLCVGASSASP